jgi:hypothetical protein
MCWCVVVRDRWQVGRRVMEAQIWGHLSFFLDASWHAVASLVVAGVLEPHATFTFWLLSRTAYLPPRSINRDTGRKNVRLYLLELAGAASLSGAPRHVGKNFVRTGWCLERLRPRGLFCRALGH